MSRTDDPVGEAAANWGPMVVAGVWTGIFAIVVGHYYPNGVESSLMVFALLAAYTVVLTVLFVIGAVIISAREQSRRRNGRSA